MSDNINLGNCMRKSKLNAILMITLPILTLFIGFGIKNLSINIANIPTPFNPTIDGTWSDDEGWDTITEEDSWLFAEYIIVNEYEHYSLTNYYYIHVDNNYLYILIDLVSDTTNNTEDEWISIFIDGDNSQWFCYDVTQWDEEEEDAHDSFCYYTEFNTFTENTTLPEQFSVNEWNTSLNEDDVSIAYGFQKTENGEIEHRIFEIQIMIDSLMYFNSSAFNIAFVGYGTLSAIYLSEYWTAPTYFGFGHFAYGWIDEYTYFRCRNVNSGDLWSPPDDYPYQNEGGI
jgi:hypothetical protein